MFSRGVGIFFCIHIFVAGSYALVPVLVCNRPIFSLTLVVVVVEQACLHEELHFFVQARLLNDDDHHHCQAEDGSVTDRKRYQLKIQQNKIANFENSGHTNNWAVLVDTSRFWFNYRHVANVLSIYRSVKRLGIPDSQIILMVADDMACNPRNPRPATVFNNINQNINVYGDDVEVDYRGYEVTVENFIRLLTGRLPPGTPRSKQLLTDEGSNILVYLTGHGGDGFLKFQDSEEVTSQELADALEQMWQKRRYNEIFFMIDTCQAASMYEKFYSPNILAVASSLVGEDSLSHHADPAIGVYIIDRYTYYALEFLEKIEPGSSKTMAQFLVVCPKSKCISTVGIRKDLYKRDTKEVPITDFFGSVRPVELTYSKLNISHVSAKNVTQRIAKKLNKKFHYAEQFPTHLFDQMESAY